MNYWKVRTQMNKTILRNIHLVNWYGFSNRTIPVSENLTLISGENECGKSTILDAVKYAYTGDTQFNKATSGYNTGVGKRNLVSYTRCLVDASSGIYARPADKIPVVYTHIALEYFDQINESSFVLGVVIETAVTDIRGTYWYAMDGKTIADISFVYEDGSLIKPYDASGFQKKYGIQMKNKKDGITLFMQMIGLKLPYQEVPKYQRKLRNIMAYNPAAKIQEFIKESVLEEHDVNFDKLKEAKKNGREVTLVYNDGMLNRLDRLTAANYGMPINTNLCENRFVKCNGATIMLQAASIYTKGEGGHWDAKAMIEVMMDVARTSLKMLGKDLFNQLTKK